MKIPSRSSHALPSVLLVLLIGSSAVLTPASATPSEPAPPPAAGAASASKDGAPFDLTDPERIAAGKKRFNANCAAYCHGAEGSGGKTPPFKGNKDFSVQGTFQVITEGRRAADVMPAWGKGFKPEEIWELVAYIQFLSTQPPAP
ncbi:MAG: cytochrome c [Burkholderiaceae bacterium]|nr:cytochrome c [Burkholderiaceae bacterium]